MVPFVLSVNDSALPVWFSPTISQENGNSQVSFCRRTREYSARMGAGEVVVVFSFGGGIDELPSLSSSTAYWAEAMEFVTPTYQVTVLLGCIVELSFG